MAGGFLIARGYWLSRSVFQIGLAVVYLIAFVVAFNQFRPLLGERGLLPVPEFVHAVPFQESPSLFFFAPKDWAFLTASALGAILSVTAIAGAVLQYPSWVNAIVWALLWTLYISFVNVGQTFYGFGWESILLEAGFFAVFLGSGRSAPLWPAILMLRWLEFRVMFGAGLIKLRGDPCWRDYTCLDYHYETQPMPNPLSWFLHWGPAWTHRFGVGFNHFSEILAPILYFLPQPLASIGAVITILFQASIMASGNLSWLNFLTIVLAVPALNDRALGLVLPLRTPALNDPWNFQKAAVAGLSLLVIYLSINPIRNMISPRQVMNTSYNALHLVGTYGAFGGITRTRYEVIIEGAQDAVLTPATIWREYEFKGKPGGVKRIPAQIAPYHLRIDWLMWFAAMSDYTQQPWFVHLMQKLLEGDPATLSLLAGDPFPNSRPTWIRADLYEYHFTTPQERRADGAWWNRKLAGMYFPTVSLQTPGFRQVLQSAGWL